MNPNWRKDYLRYRAIFGGLISQYQKRADLKAYLEVILSLVTISIFTLFALRPTLITIAQLIKDIEAKKQVLSVIDAKLVNIARAQSLFQQEQNKITLLDSAMPKSGEPDIFSRQIEGLIGAHPIDLASFSIDSSTITSEKPPEATPVATTTNTQVLMEGANATGFTITGAVSVDNYSTLAEFLTDFEKLRRPAIIDEIRFTKGLERDFQQQQKQRVLVYIRGRIPYALFVKRDQSQH